MKVGLFTTLYRNQPLEKVFQLLNKYGVHMAEIGAGGYPGMDHCNPDILLHDVAKLQEFKDLLSKYEIEISALSCHSNPIHPDADIAKREDSYVKNTILMAEKLGIHQINTFSGCAGDCKDSRYPNWVTCAWPEDYQKILEYQWEECLIPYWTDTVQFAKEHGVNKIGFELHPGFMIYNTSSMLRIREAVGKELGANLDPSHLIWQGMDPVLVIRELKDAIFHFHAKDTKIDSLNTAVNGVLDTTSLADLPKRSWYFRTVGYGNDRLFWCDVISELRKVGYDHAISIEHEDALMSDTEGFLKALKLLQEVVIETQPTAAFWA